jgi:hypothetical protein
MPIPNTGRLATINAIDLISLGIRPDTIPSATTHCVKMSTKFDRNASQLWAYGGQNIARPKFERRADSPFASDETKSDRADSP